MRTNIYKAMSFDRLHAYLLGLFLHLLRILKAIVALMSRKAQTVVDERLVVHLTCEHYPDTSCAASTVFPPGQI